jgi:hypothetical protein
MDGSLMDLLLNMAFSIFVFGASTGMIIGTATRTVRFAGLLLLLCVLLYWFCTFAQYWDYLT